MAPGDPTADCRPGSPPEQTGVKGHRAGLVRPPYGLLTGPAAVAARRLGLRPVLWTTEGRDWHPDATADSILARVGADLRQGGTVLLHDYSASGSWRATLAALPRLAELLDRRDLAAGPLADHGLGRPVSPPEAR